MKKNFKLLLYFLKVLKRTSSTFLPISISITIVQGVSPLINIIIPKLIIDELLGSKDIPTLVFLVATLAGANLLIKIIEISLNRVKLIEMEKIQLKIGGSLADKSTKLRYEDIERKSVLELKERAYFGMFNFYELTNLIGIAGKSLISIISLIILLFTFNGWIIPVLTVLTLLNSLVYKSIAELRYQDSIISIPANRGFSYYGTLASDFSYGKDIRLSHSAEFLQLKANKYLKKVIEIFSKENTEIGKFQGITGINMQFQSFLVYGLLAWSAIKGILSIGDFTMFGNAARQFTQALTALVDSLIGINGLCMHIEPFESFMELAENSQNLEKTTKNSFSNDDEALVFEFKDVWFKYPGSDIYVLQDINIELGNNEKLSIVGLNGAGKTTFIKLLCRLYQPTEGTILLNGIDIKLIPLEEYLQYLSVVFQDFQLLGYSIAMNIAASKTLDLEKIDGAIRFFGFEEVIEDLPNGLETSVNRSLNKQGVTFSGGQMQKFAIARALYKNSPVAILDEPTSALDPKSEYEIYSHFDELAEGKIAIYISHRLSSTKFTDRIAVFKDGRIVETGTHKDLLAEKGLYSEMFSKQAQYYQ